ncbi:MAG TPA: exodeoxyribonuclease VII large subunit [Candidatus Kryptonia bacterium]|nr:exodeoxyribonuclease VII large subunit [Candidatus Kryptonia bacterium]
MSQLPLSIPVLTVTQLAQRVRETLEAELDDCWVVGEISNFRVPPSGHFYFSLKDRRSQLAAVMFRSANQVLPFRPQDGMEVVVRGHVGIYEARGDLQLYVEHMEPRGQGAQQLALEQLKQRLLAEGLFASERKRPLPAFPRAVGIATAASGAAIHDLLRILRDRLPAQRVILRPVRVQGAAAPADIVAAIHDLNEVSAVEVIIVGRGGGSVEDLWAFNDERVARAIAASRAPVVSAVGHEVDMTVADLVADRRAPTPTAAAAMVVPDRRQLAESVREANDAMRAALTSRLHRERERLTALRRHVRDPRQLLVTWRLRVDELGERALRGAATTIRLARERWRGTGERLQAVSPLAVLERGYSITRRSVDDAVVRDSASVPPGTEVRLNFARGAARATVTTSN